MLMNVSAKFVKLLIIETPFLLPTAVFVFTLIFVWCIYRDLSEEMQLLRTNEAPELVNVPLVRQQRINEDGTLSLTTAGSDTSDTSSASTSQTEQSTIVNPDNAACARQLAVDEPTSAAFGASNTSYASTSEIEKSAVGNPDHVARVRQLAIDEDEALPPTTAGSGTSDTSGYLVEPVMLTKGNRHRRILLNLHKLRPLEEPVSISEALERGVFSNVLENQNSKDKGEEIF